GMPGEPGHHRVALVAGAADGVENLVLHPQHACHQVEVAADELGFEQLTEALRIQRAAVEDRLAWRGPGVGPSIPGLHEFAEVDVADLGAVEAAHAGGNRAGVVRHVWALCRSGGNRRGKRVAGASRDKGWRP